MKIPVDKVLTTNRLDLEPLVSSHADATFADWSDPGLYGFIPTDPPANVAALRERYQQLESRRSPDGEEVWLNWMIRVRATGRYVGLVEVSVDRWGSAYLAYFVFAPEQRRGIATEACQRVIAYLRDECGATRVVAEMDTRNQASIHLIEALGCKRTGYSQAVDHFKGASSDEYRYERDLSAP